MAIGSIGFALRIGLTRVQDMQVNDARKVASSRQVYVEVELVSAEER